MMAGGSPPDNPDYWKAHAERRSELLRSGKSTDGVAGMIVDLLMGLFGWIFSGLPRLWRKRS